MIDDSIQCIIAKTGRILKPIKLLCAVRICFSDLLQPVVRVLSKSDLFLYRVDIMYSEQFVCCY